MHRISTLVLLAAILFATTTACNQQENFTRANGVKRATSITAVTEKIGGVTRQVITSVEGLLPIGWELNTNLSNWRAEDCEVNGRKLTKYTFFIHAKVPGGVSKLYTGVGSSEFHVVQRTKNEILLQAVPCVDTAEQPITAGFETDVLQFGSIHSGSFHMGSTGAATTGGTDLTPLWVLLGFVLLCGGGWGLWWLKIRKAPPQTS